MVEQVRSGGRGWRGWDAEAKVKDNLERGGRKKRRIREGQNGKNEEGGDEVSRDAKMKVRGI